MVNPTRLQGAKGLRPSNVVRFKLRSTFYVLTVFCLASANMQNGSSRHALPSSRVLRKARKPFYSTEDKRHVVTPKNTNTKCNESPAPPALSRCGPRASGASKCQLATGIHQKLHGKRNSTPAFDTSSALTTCWVQTWCRCSDLLRLYIRQDTFIRKYPVVAEDRRRCRACKARNTGP